MRCEQSYYDCVVIYDNRGIIRENEIREISFNNLKYNTFELIEDEIDIDNIEELELIRTNFIDIDKNELKDNINKNRINVNELVQAVKQLNKEIKSIKEK